MKEKFSGYKRTLKRIPVTPYEYDNRLIVTHHLRCIVSCWESGRKLWQQTTKIDRISGKPAMDDGQHIITDSILQNFH